MTRICRTHGDTLAACREQHARIRCSGSQLLTSEQPDYPSATIRCSHCGRRFEEPGYRMPVHYESKRAS